MDDTGFKNGSVRTLRPHYFSVEKIRTELTWTSKSAWTLLKSVWRDFTCSQRLDVTLGLATGAVSTAPVWTSGEVMWCHGRWWRSLPSASVGSLIAQLLIFNNILLLRWSKTEHFQTALSRIFFTRELLDWSAVEKIWSPATKNQTKIHLTGLILFVMPVAIDKMFHKTKLYV